MKTQETKTNFNTRAPASVAFTDFPLLRAPWIYPPMWKTGSDVQLNPCIPTTTS